MIDSPLKPLITSARIQREISSLACELQVNRYMFSPLISEDLTHHKSMLANDGHGFLIALKSYLDSNSIDTLV